MVYPCLIIGIGRAIFELLQFNTPVSGIPILLMSGVVVGVQLMSLFALIFASAIAWVTHIALVEILENVWVTSERKKHPDTSFSIPYWPFQIIAAIPTGAVFLSMMAVWLFLVFLLPAQFAELEDAVSGLHFQYD